MFEKGSVLSLRVCLVAKERVHAVGFLKYQARLKMTNKRKIIHRILGLEVKSVKSRHRGCPCPDKVKVHKSLRALAEAAPKEFSLLPKAEGIKVEAVACSSQGSELSERISGTLPNALPSMPYQHDAETLLANRQHEMKTKQGICAPPARLSKSAGCLNSPWK